MKKIKVYQNEELSIAYKKINAIAYGLNNKRTSGDVAQAKRLYRDTRLLVLKSMGFIYKREEKKLIQEKAPLPEFEKLFRMNIKEIIKFQKICKENKNWSLFPIDLDDDLLSGDKINKEVIKKSFKKKSIQTKTTNNDQYNIDKDPAFTSLFE